MQNYTVAAYYWPSYHYDPRSLIFWPEGHGEWETVRKNKPKFEGHDQDRQPLWGYINEADPFVMEMQIEAASSYGVNCFIFDWYWYDRHPFLENCLNNGYLKARNNDKVKFYIMWANHNVNLTWDKRNAGKWEEMKQWEGEHMLWHGGIPRPDFEIAARRIIENYFSHPSYVKIDGKPVLCIYELSTLLSGLGGLEETKDALLWLREETKKHGFPDLHLQFTLRSEQVINVSGIDDVPLTNQKEILEYLGADSVTHYQFIHFTDVDRPYPAIMESVQKEYEYLDQNYKMPYFPHVSSGWDNNPRYEMLVHPITTENTPAHFQKALEQAKRYADAHPKQPPIITVNSWNEWTESSFLQPCTKYGYAYLEAVKNVFK